MFPDLSYQKESGLETGDAIQAVLAKCREVERNQERVRCVCACECVCVCVFLHSGWQLSDFLTNNL